MLARNTLINMFGQGVPVLVALVAIPILVSELGTDRFGVLSIAIITIGYFGLFDLGLGRAMTQLIAERLGQGDEDEVVPLAWTGLLLMFGLGVVGAVILALIAPFLTRSLLQIPEPLQVESLTGFYLLALSLPFVISTAALRGMLEADQRFGLVNVLRVPMGIFTFAGPLAVLPFSRSLAAVIAVLVAGRVVAWAAHLVLCLRALPFLRRFEIRGWEVVRPLFHIGGWLTVSNIVSPLMVYADRYLIGAFLSMTAVTYYVTPYELVTKLWIITAALLGVLYPAFAASFTVDPSRTVRLYDQGVRVTYLIFFPLALMLVALAAPGLGLWLGEEFATNSAEVLQWLAAGIFINSIGQVPYTAIQGIGRADITAKLHLIELPLYIGIFLFAVDRFGVVGAAMAWTLRVAVDTGLLLVLAGRLLPGAGVIAGRAAGLMIPGLLALVGVAAIDDLSIRIAVLTGVLAVYGLHSWRAVLSADERRRIAEFSPRSDTVRPQVIEPGQAETAGAGSRVI